ncbi:hypothetical protein [Paenibacillus macerans]|uniref:hypothetical protein n=1 Tax=Paenibacillus macerans TaxID=44252 RepID=UPI0022DF81CE|nr:hypothetical protein [Paenibacillus macerans]
MFRTMFLMLFSCVALVVVRDVGVAYAGYLKIEKSVEQSLDAAIIAATEDMERTKGFLRIDKNAARETIATMLQSNLKLNGALENTHFHDSLLNVELGYTSNIPRIEVEYKTHVNFSAGQMFGVPTWEVSVKKHTPYLSEFI